MTMGTPGEGSPPRLRLHVENQLLVPAGDIGGLLVALSNDYRRATKGRALVLTSLQTGTITALLQDAAILWTAVQPYAQGAAAVAEGGKAIYDLIKPLYGVYSKPLAQSFKASPRKPIGTSTVRALAQIAQECRSTIEFNNELTRGGGIRLLLG